MSDTSAAPTLGVVVPAYNAERYLAEALETILAQSEVRVEVVVVDDCSTDGTRRLAESFADRGVRCLGSPARRGVGAARNLGIAAVTGEFLAFLDADDLWPAGRTGILVAALRSHGGPCIAIGMAEQFICPTLSPAQQARLRAPPPPVPAYMAGGVLMRRTDFDRVGPFDVSLTFGEFIDWFGRARKAGLAEVQVPDIVLRRRLHADNMTIRQRASATDYLEVIRRELARKKDTNTRS